MPGNFTVSLLLLVMFEKGVTPDFLFPPPSKSHGRFVFKFLSFSLSRLRNGGSTVSCTKDWLLSKLVLEGIPGSKPSDSSL